MMGGTHTEEGMKKEIDGGRGKGGRREEERKEGGKEGKGGGREEEGLQ